MPRRVTRLAAFGSIAPLTPSDSLRSSSGNNARHPRRPVQASPVTGFRITPSSGVLAAEGDADSVLRTSAVTAFSAPRRVLPTVDHDSAGQHVGDVQHRAAV